MSEQPPNITPTEPNPQPEGLSGEGALLQGHVVQYRDSERGQWTVGREFTEPGRPVRLSGLNVEDTKVLLHYKDSLGDNREVYFRDGELFDLNAIASLGKTESLRINGMMDDVVIDKPYTFPSGYVTGPIEKVEVLDSRYRPINKRIPGSIERAESPFKAADEIVGANGPDSSAKPERAWDKAEGKVVQYGEPDEDGNVKVGVEFSKPDDVLKWAENDLTNGPDRRIIMESKDGSLVFVQGNTVHYLKKDPTRGTFSMVRTTELAAADHLPDKNGKSWILEGSTEAEDIKLDEIQKVHVGWTKWGKRYAEEEAHEKISVDPFEVAEDVVKMFADTQKHQAQPAKSNPSPPDRRFATDQSFLSWNRKDRAKRKKLLRSNKLGRLVAGALTTVDYFTSISDPRLSNKYLDSVKENDALPKVSKDRISKIAARLGEAGGRTVERGVRAKNLVRSAGSAALSKAVDYSTEVHTRVRLQNSEHLSRMTEQANAIGGIALSHMIGARQFLSLKLQSRDKANGNSDGEDEEDDLLASSS